MDHLMDVRKISTRGVLTRDEFGLYFGYPSLRGPGTTVNSACLSPKKFIRLEPKPDNKKSMRMQHVLCKSKNRIT